MTKRTRGWCWTLNNYSEEEYENIKEIMHTCTAEKWIIGKEVGSNGTPHLQGYLYLKNGKTFNVMKEMIAKAHWEAAKGNPEHNYKYCSKDGDFECKGFERSTKVKYNGYTTLEEQMENEVSESTRKELRDDELMEWMNTLKFDDGIYEDEKDLFEKLSMYEYEIEE